MIECGECAVWQHIHCLPENKGRAAKKVKIDKWLKKDFVCQECLAKQKSPGADDEDFEMDEGGEESPDVAVEDETDSGESIQKRPRSRAGFSNGNASVPSGQPIKLVLRGNPPMITKGTLAQLEHTKDILRSRLLQLQQGVGPATGGVVLSSSAVIQGGTSSGPSSPARPLGPQQVPSPQQFQRIQQQALSSQQARALQKQAQSPHRMQPAQQHALQAQQVQTLHQQQQQYLMQQQALAMQIQQQQYANQIIALAMSNARASAQGSSLAQGTNPSSPAPTVVSPGSTPMSPAQIMALQMHAQQQQQQHQVQWQQMVQMQLLQQQQSTQAQQQRLHQEQVQSQMSGQQPMSTSDQIVAMPSTKPPPPQRSQTLMSLGPDSCQTEPGEDGVSSVAAKKRTLWADSSVEEEGDEEEDAPTVNTVHQPEEREGTVASGSPRLLDKTLQDLASL